MNYLVYIPAAMAEIAGCFCFWAWWRLDWRAVWLLPGTLSLILFAWLLAMTPPDTAGRSFAAYGGIYIAASLVWLWLAEGVRPDRWDLIGAVVCICGAAIIVLAPRGA